MTGRTLRIPPARPGKNAATAPGQPLPRLVFGKIGELARAEAPALFGDYTVTDGAWVPGWRKV
jgi:thymidylate synthase (FAD)